MNRAGISIVLNGAHHLENQIKAGAQFFFDPWIIVHGATKSVFCTSWCKELPSNYYSDGLSIDGTTEYLKYLSKQYDNIKVIEKQDLWDGKIDMFNEAIKHVPKDCEYLWEMDIDEYWLPNQLDNAEDVLDSVNADVAAFACDYMLTDDIVVRGEWGESITHGYKRLWKYKPGSKFITHEPPKLDCETKLVPPQLLPRFKHLSYYYRKDVKFKSLWYGGHENILQGWDSITNGTEILPCSIERLFRKSVPDAWKKTIVTYK